MSDGVLKRCPCCGGEAEIRMGTRRAKVVCTNCYLRTKTYPFMDGTEDSAWKAAIQAASDWNRRAE